jgi:hypothetical protein
MVKIEYIKSQSGMDNCFELLFLLADYIPTSMLKDIDANPSVELKYYMWLFEKYQLFDGPKEGKELIWSKHWDCKLDGIPFSMYYDEDYGFISFSVDKAYLQQREELAEKLRNLVEESAEG